MFGGRKPSVPGSTAHQTQAVPAIGTSTAPSASSPSQPARPIQAVGFETAIGIHTSLKGELHSHANIRIDGTFEGSIEVEGNVLVGETAQITADIHGHNVTIAGAVHGDVVGQKVQLLRTGRVWGDLNASSIITEEGAFIDGKITMHTHPAAKGLDGHDEQAALPAPEISLVHPLAEDVTSGEPVEVEMMDEQASNEHDGLSS